jgi:predicted nucleic acid-binding protein
LFAGESGAENVMNIIQDAVDGKADIKISQVNLLEVCYHIFRVYGQEEAKRSLNKIQEFPIEIIKGMTNEAFAEAVRIKALYKIPLGDSILVAECIIRKGVIVTSDRADLEKIEKAEDIKINWFRPKVSL